MWLAFLATTDADGEGSSTSSVGSDGNGSTSCGKDPGAGTGDGQERSGSAEWFGMYRVDICAGQASFQLPSCQANFRQMLQHGCINTSLLPAAYLSSCTDVAT